MNYIIFLTFLMVASPIAHSSPAKSADYRGVEQLTSSRGEREMFAVIYRGYVKPGREEEYKKVWRKVASYFVEYRGAIGSCLHQTEEGLFLAYSRWPDKKTRDASWPGENAPSSELPDDIREAIITIKDCSDQERKLPEICMNVVDDLLLNQP